MQHGGDVPLIRLNGFTGYYGKQAKIEADRCQAGAGEWIAVVGENGAGKSTLLKAMMQLIPTRGEYVLGGRPVKRFEDVSGMLGYVFQNPEFQFVTNSVYEEIAYTLRVGPGSDSLDAAALHRQVQEQLVLFGLEGHENQHPFQLSLGQKRRLSVAAAIVRGQKAVLLDEPTFGQDAKNTFAVLEKLEDWRRMGTTIIMVTHDMDIVRHFSTRVWRIERGRLVADTDPDDFLQANEGSLKQGVAVHL
jgi:energy-coupling factor transport system ATP-binding protein